MADPGSRPVRRSNHDRTGITTTLIAAKPMPTGEWLAASAPASARIAWTPTYAARAKNDSAMTRSATRSRAAWSRPANCQATAAAEATSPRESRPKPTSAADDATVPAVIATTASTTLYEIVAATTSRTRRRSTAARVAAKPAVAWAEPMALTVRPRRSRPRAAGTAGRRPRWPPATAAANRPSSSGCEVSDNTEARPCGLDVTSRQLAVRTTPSTGRCRRLITTVVSIARGIEGRRDADVNRRDRPSGAPGAGQIGMSVVEASTRPPTGARLGRRLGGRLGQADVVAVIAAGGALGGLGRWALNEVLPPAEGRLPWSTLLENVTGGLLLGVLMVFLLEVWRPGRYARPFLGVGLLGGFTTFSTYTSETRVLLLEGRVPLALTYLFGTAVLCLAATWAGVTLARSAAGAGRRPGSAR